MNILNENRFCRVELKPSANLIRITRTAEPFQSVRDVEWTMDQVRRALLRIDPVRHVMLVDLRCAPMSARKDIEEATTLHNREIRRHFSRVAMLLESAVGRLQAGRVNRDNPNAPALFTDEREALTFLGVPTKS